jgi:hypothetical protein
MRQEMRIHTDEPYLQHREMWIIVNGNETERSITERKTNRREEK